jgi:UDP-N-acetylglucosamine diphosphorylase/glucosamine-1-phosphate N-acetyltransferase
VAANGEDLCRDWRSLGTRPAPVRRIFGVILEEGAALAALLEETAFGDASRCVLYPGVHILEEAHVLFGAGAVCKPGVVLDASDGPILLGAGCRVEANAVIQGPAYVGPGSTVHPLTRLREGSAVGAGCKVGGEIEEVVMLDLSNKQHDGFLGHAHVGSWVNLGADTNASDLKNNYGTVKVDLGEGPMDTGLRFVGPTLGDHVRTGINSMLTTGAVVGVCANVFGADFPPRFVPSYAWGGADSLQQYDLEKALQTARTVLARRSVRWLPAYEELLRRIHAETAAQRSSLG